MMNQKRIAAFKLLSGLVRFIGALSKLWLLGLIVLFFMMETGPHLRVEYTYRGSGEYRTYIRCTYLGARGFQTIYPDTGQCSVIAILNTKGGN
ncbi:MAG: hypothetical protein AAGI66_06565 [Cyanobacteria bacterium P01_H01_bin.74]